MYIYIHTVYVMYRVYVQVTVHQPRILEKAIASKCFSGKYWKPTDIPDVQWSCLHTLGKQWYFTRTNNGSSWLKGANKDQRFFTPHLKSHSCSNHFDQTKDMSFATRSQVQLPKNHIMKLTHFMMLAFQKNSTKKTPPFWATLLPCQISPSNTPPTH